MKKTIMFSALLALAGQGYCADLEIKTFPAKGINGISANTEVGPITVAGSPGDIKVEVFGNLPDTCVLTMGVLDGKLLLKAESSKILKVKGPFGFGGKWVDCAAGFKVSAPSGIDFEAKSGTGKIGVSGITGTVSVKSGTGAVALSALAGKVEVDSGTGDIFGELCSKQLTVKGGSVKVNLKGLCGPVEIGTGTGSVALDWLKAPASGTARVKTGTADISVTFPAGAAVGANLKSGTGSIKNEFAAEGPFQLQAKSGTGDISVLKAR